MAKFNHLGSVEPNIEGASIAVVQTKWYREHTDNMINKFNPLVVSWGGKVVCHKIASGAVEVPLLVKKILKSYPKLEAVICFGAIVKGETYHFEMIANECMRGLGELMLEFERPIITEILPVYSIDQLKARSRDDEYNKGLEAAYATAESIMLLRDESFND